MLGFRAGHHINNNINNHQNICIGSYSGPSSASGVNNRLYIDASGTVNDGLIKIHLYMVINLEHRAPVSNNI